MKKDLKKGLIVTGSIIAIIVIVLGVVKLTEKLGSDDNTATTVEPYANAQLGITVDSWLKIHEITECDGRVAVVVENLSETDVEYAKLTVKTSVEELSFNVSALLSGTKAILICNQDVGSDPEENYTLWEIKDKLVFEKSPSMHEDEIKITVTDGSISLENISDADISSDIYVCYKEKKNGLLNGSATGRFKISGLNANSQTFVKAEKLNENNCQIIFIEYYDKEL